MSVPETIVELLEDYLDGELTPAGREIVTAWAGESEANGRELAAWFVSEVQLVEAARLTDMRMVFEGLPFNTRTRGILSLGNKPIGKSERRLWHKIAIAASLLMVLAAPAAWLNIRSGGETKKFADQARASEKSNQQSENALPAVAIMARLENCVWGAKSKPIRVGQDIPPGTKIALKSGLAQVIFESGAEVVLRGPCRFQVDSSMLGHLSAGTISAEVPSRAAGFTIRGPSSEVIDLGTRFGFSVGSDGNSEVHVFQGEVISRELDEQGEVIGSEIRLKTDQAVLFPGARKQAQRLAANEAKFAVEVPPLWRQDTIEPLVVERRLALWLRASHGVQKDKHQRVIAWQDLAVGHNHIANDAFQPEVKARPQYVEDAMSGRPAIRFNGTSTYLTTTPLTTTDNQTIVLVFQHAPPEIGEHGGGQIINYNGPPSRYLPDVHSPGVLQVGEKVTSRDGPAGSIAAKAFVGRDSRGADVSAGIVASDSLGLMHPRVAVYLYNNSENVAALYVDGQRVAESSAPTKVAVSSRKVIGKHGIFDQWYFRGDLAEVAIFNTALSQIEIANLSWQLMERYQIARSPSQL